MTDETIRRFKTMWRNAKTSEMKKRIRRDFFMQDYSFQKLENGWELVMVGRK